MLGGVRALLRPLIGVVVFGLAAAPVALPLPPEAREAYSELARACPECVDRSVIPCGTPAIGEGARFAPNLHQGDPARGYLLSGEYLDAFRNGYRAPSLSGAELASRLREALESSRLIAVEAGFASLRSLGPPTSVAPQVSKTHRACLEAPEAYDCSGAECCNKKHGSTEIRATWDDPKDEHELVWLHHPSAAQMLLRRGKGARLLLPGLGGGATRRAGVGRSAMTRFEYLSVLVSIVIALGITEVTISWGRLIQSRARVTFSAIHGFWSAFLLVMMIQLWWGFWNFRTVEEWSFLALVAVVAEAVTLVLCALLMSPRDPGPDHLDLERHYLENARPFFLLGGLLLVQLTLVDDLVLGTPFLHPENAVRLPGVALTVAGAATSSRRVHMTLPFVAAVLLVGFLFVAVRL